MLGHNPLSTLPLSTVAPPVPAPELSWHPTYTDRVSRAPRCVALLLSATTMPIGPPVPNGPSWQGEWPDRVPAVLRARALLLDAHTRPLEPPAAAPAVPDLWTAIYPDRVVRAASVRANGTMWTGIELPPIPDAPSWQPRYLDRIRPAVRLHASNQDAYTAPTLPPIPDVPSWRGTWLDRIQPATRIAMASQQAVARSIDLPIPDVPSWRGTWPDRIWPATRIAAASQQAVARSIDLPIPDVPSWRGTWPDRIWPATRIAAASQLASVAPLEPPQEIAPPLAWNPIYPIALRRVALLPWMIEAYARSPVPLIVPDTELVIITLIDNTVAVSLVDNSSSITLVDNTVTIEIDGD